MTSTPLTDAELDRLETLLDSDLLGEDVMQLDEIQAMLCALVSGPVPVMPSVWLPEVLGERAAAVEPAALEELIGLLMRLNNDIAATLLANEMVSPIIYPLDEAGEHYDYATWADAYIVGANLAGDWYEHVGKHGEDLSDLLEPLFLLNGMLKEDAEQHGDAWYPPAEEAALLQGAEENLPLIVQSIYNFWRARRGGATIRREADKVGRNDPCPCGSGKKFKQCCGRPEKLN